MSKYFTANDMNNLVFYQVPKVLLIGEKYKEMNPNALKLYIVLIDRIKLSMTNNWKDELGRYYVRMSIEKGSDLLGFSDSTFKRAKKELTKFELLEEKREGKNKTNVLYPLQVEFTDDDVIKINREVDDVLEEAEKSAQDHEERWIVQNELSGKERMGQIEPTGTGQNDLSWIGQIEPLDGSKRTTNNNNYNKNKINKNKINIIGNNLLTKDEIINKLILEYMKKGLSKEVCFMVLKEVEENPEVHNFGGYFRNSLENALYRHNVKHGIINPQERIKQRLANSNIPYYDWLNDRDEDEDLPY